MYWTPEWRATVRAARLRAGNACERCGATGVTLDAAHTVPTTMLIGNARFYDLNLIELLCRSCHNLSAPHRS
jgi:5-methylcytosine-specific restriction endonuclease McrA